MAATHANTKHHLPPDADIVACLNKGMTTKQIADHFGIGYDPVCRRIRYQRLRAQMAATEPTTPPRQREGVVIDKRVHYHFGRNEFREIEISLPAVSILRDCERYGRAA